MSLVNHFVDGVSDNLPVNTNHESEKIFKVVPMIQREQELITVGLSKFDVFDAVLKIFFRPDMKLPQVIKNFGGNFFNRGFVIFFKGIFSVTNALELFALKLLQAVEVQNIIPHVAIFINLNRVAEVALPNL